MSSLFHIVLFLILDKIIIYVPVSKYNTIKTIEFNYVKKEQKNKLRTLGIFGGKKDAIYVPTQTKIKNIEQVSPSMLVPDTPLKAKILPNSLRNSNKSLSIRRNKVFKKTGKKNNFRTSLRKTHSNMLLPQTDIDVNFELPEGVSKSELNKAELVYASFRRRVGITFLSTLFSTYNHYQRIYPHFILPYKGQHETLTARATYDKFGNIKRIKIIKWSKHDTVQNFFQKLMEKMKIIQNPPKSLINKKDEVIIFFSVRIG